MKHLETELDISFRLASEFGLPCWVHDPPNSGSGGSTQGDEEPGEEEVVLQVELTGNPFCTSRAISGKAQGLLVRSHCSWRVKAPEASAELVAAATWRASTPSRPTTPSINLLAPAGAPPPVEVTSRPLGDFGHALRLDMRERVPETLLLSRVQPRKPSGAEGRSQTSSDASSKALDFLMDTEEQCKRMEGSVEEKLKAHCDILASRSKDAEVEDSVSIEAAGAGAAGEANGPPPGSVQGYLRDIRAVLRSLGSGIPSAARLLESIVKGLVLAADSELATAARRIKRLEGRVEKLEEVMEREKALKRTISDLQKERDHTQEKLASADKKHEVETRALRDRIEGLKGEIQRLTPDQGQVEGMTGLMADYQVLMQEMEEETGRSNKILRDMTNYTAGLMREASRSRQTQHGRVVEQQNGEIVLRPYSVADQSTQVTEADVLRQDLAAPVRLWRPPVRQILVAFEEQEVPSMSLEELSSEIDKIYTAKIAADLEADAAGLQRSELAIFIVEYYLDQLGSVRLAQQKFVSIVDCIRMAEKGTSPTPAKVALFARFLEICHYEAALPLTVLNVALKAKSLIATKLETPMVSFAQKVASGGGRRRHESVPLVAQASLRGADGAEPQVGVAIAYQAAVKALPSGGSLTALRELFLGLARIADVEGVQGARNGNVREFYVLMLLLHDGLHCSRASVLRDLISRAEQRHPVSTDEFQDALKDARVLGIDDAVWKSRLCVASGPTISSELFLDYLGGGSFARLPRAYVAEGALLEAIVDAVTADYAERANHLERLWQRHSVSLSGPMTYADFKTVLQSAEPSLSAPMIRTLFLMSVETSRSCTQQEGNFCSRRESLEPSPSGEFGGEVVTFKLLVLTALRWQLFLKEGPYSTGGNRITVVQAGADGKGSPRRNLPLGAPSGRRTSTEAKNRGSNTPRRTPRSG